METILIIGASGRIASELTASLDRFDNVHLKLTTSRTEAVPELQARYPQAQVILADWHDSNSLITAFQGVDRVVMIPPDFVLDEPLAVQNIVAAYKANPSIKQLVRLIAIPEGATIADMDPDYMKVPAGTALHLVGKALLERTDMPLTYLNMVAWFTSNIPWFFADDIKQQQKLRLPGLDVARAYLTEADMTDALVKVLTDDACMHINKQYNLTSEKRFSFNDIAKQISTLVDKPIQYENSDQGLIENDQAFISEYIQHESKIWQRFPELSKNHITDLIGRSPMELPEWLAQNKHYFN
ncbi:MULTISPECIES: NmrA family NAD(P)-binding protein [unclassified Motilimonas]|uniref:NmrA family NAD(P)-binding protein n=1 Tax=Motilimonas TaxID=1914248 RepID=UPI001E54B946|nr:MULTISPECIES: NmrA family NAD(P)-binding protein [unclassified Motilimonas]MCE0558366.1 NmrA family NAD(P)-binding protein [Motilimonas sp. E26]MDO6525282.1 NmrA family NAD(P)-binding protein [Motilimonas sp. 1_MG-2023]